MEARDAAVADVLAALTQRFGLRMSGTVGDRHISANAKPLAATPSDFSPGAASWRLECVRQCGLSSSIVRPYGSLPTPVTVATTVRRRRSITDTVPLGGALGSRRGPPETTA